MNPMQLMELSKDSFTQNDLAIYRVIRANPEQVIAKTTSILASDCGVSQPALSRFVKSLGYDRYRDFRSDIAAWIAAQQAEPASSGQNRLPYFETLRSTLDAIESVLTDEFMRSLVAFLRKHKRVYASGAAKSFQPAALLEVLMRRNKFGIHAVSNDSLSELVDYMDDDDLLIYFSVSGKQSHLKDLAGSNAHVMLVTANERYECQSDIDRAVVLPYAGIDAESAPVSPIAFDVFVELLTNYMAIA